MKTKALICGFVFTYATSRFFHDAAKMIMYIYVKLYKRNCHCHHPCFTLIIISFRTNGSGQTVQTQIRLLLEEQSDQGLHCLLFHLHLLESFLCCKANLFLEFRVITAIFWVP